jgi:hypothetical protein
MGGRRCEARWDGNGWAWYVSGGTWKPTYKGLMRSGWQRVVRGGAEGGNERVGDAMKAAGMVSGWT